MLNWLFSIIHDIQEDFFLGTVVGIFVELTWFQTTVGTTVMEVHAPINVYIR